MVDAAAFPCGHPRTPDNSRPSGMQHGKPRVKCRTCQKRRNALSDRKRYALPERREMVNRQKREARAVRKATGLEYEVEVLKRELAATVDALLEARRHASISTNRCDPV